MFVSYDEGAYCLSVMMRGRIVCQYDEGVLFVSMMRGRIVCQYDEGAYCLSVMMSVLFVSYDEGAYWGVLFVSYDEGAYCLSVDVLFVSYGQL